MFIHEGRIIFDGDREALERCPEPGLCEFLHPEAQCAGAKGGAL